MSALDEVRVKRGSTLISFAPRSFALATHLKELGLATEETLNEIESEVIAVVDEAVAYAESSPDPEATDALRHVFYEGEV